MDLSPLKLNKINIIALKFKSRNQIRSAGSWLEDLIRIRSLSLTFELDEDMKKILNLF